MPVQPILYVACAAWEALFFILSIMSSFCPVLNIFLSLCKNTEWILMKFIGSTRYYKQIKWLHLWRNWNRNKGTGYERKFELMSVSSAAMWNWCWCLAIEFTNSLHRLQKMWSRTQFHVNFKVSLQISYKCIKNFGIRYTPIFSVVFLTADTFICQFVLCTFLLTIATLVWKTFTTDDWRMQRQRHHIRHAVFNCLVKHSFSHISNACIVL